MFVEYFVYEECSFKITKEGGQFWAKYEEIITHSDDLEDLKNNKIPEKYHSNRVFKL